MHSYTNEDLELHGLTEFEREVFDAFFMRTSKDIKKSTQIGIQSRSQEITREELVLTNLIATSNDVRIKCEEELNKEAEPFNKYHDLCAQSVIDRIKLFGYDSYSPKKYFINKEDIFTDEDYNKFLDVPRELDEEKKGKLRETILERDKQIEEAKKGAEKYLQTPFETRKERVFEPHKKALENVNEQIHLIDRLKKDINALKTISDKMTGPVNKEVGLNKLNSKRSEYNKINRASRFFSYFVPNAWTKAGKARNEIKSYKNFLKRNGFTENEISTGKTDVSTEKREIIQDEPIERKSIEINELKNEGLNSSKENMVDEPNEKEKEVVKAVEEPVYKAPQK